MLIRRCVAEDMPKLLEIWLQATLHAHDYLPAAAWWPRQELMRQRLQATDDIWVVEAQAEIDVEPFQFARGIAAFKRRIFCFEAVAKFSCCQRRKRTQQSHADN